MAAYPTVKSLKAFSAFVHERHRIYIRKEAGQPKPWTKDPVLQAFRFTNVYRELDTVTAWVRENWREPNAEHPDLWFAMAVARLINWPVTLAEIGFPSAWSARAGARMNDVVTRLKDRGEKTFTSAYIINQAVTGGYGMSKAEYLATVVFPDLWKRREFIRPREGDHLAEFHERLMTGYGMGSFLAAQVVADLKHTLPLKNAPDWHTWAASGPGSRRGLNILLGQDPATNMKESLWRSTLQAVQGDFNLHHRDILVLGSPLDAQDLQNCLCEYSKYTRGYSRQRYQGTKQ